MSILTVVQVYAFFRHPKHWLPLLGALIVFVTYVVKEGLEERWKETASAITAAEYAFAVRTDHIEMTKGDYYKLDSMWPKATDIHRVLRYMDFCESINRSSTLMIGNANLLMVLLPETDELRLDFNILDSRVRQERALIRSFKFGANQLLSDEVAAQTLKDLEKRSIQLRDIKKREAALQHKIGDSISSSMILDSEFAGSGVLPEVFNRCEEIRNRNERKATWAWWISAGLFALGWSLGVLGKLYGVPVESGSGE